MAVSQPLFGVWDYVVVVVVLLISSSIGIYYRFTGGKQKTVEEYLLADKNMSITPVAFSLMASFMSAITLLGVSSENYTYGFQFIIIIISYAIFTPVAAYLYLPIFFKLQATSAYEYLELRFGKVCRLAASFSYTLQMTFYMGIVVYAPALALEALTGINKVVAILAMGLVCTFYSTLGGMKAVLITDVFQSLLMFAAVFSVIGSALVDKGSFAEIWRIAKLGQRTDLLNFNPDPTVRHSWFSLIIGGGITFLSLYAVNQTQVQRYLTIRTLKGAQKALWWNLPILTCLCFTTSFSGLAIYSKYFDCDPVKANYINSIDQLMPYYVVDTMGHLPGLSGIFVAGIFSAALSTVSAALNSLAAVTIEDYIKPLCRVIYKRDLSPESSSWQTKVIAFLYGLVCLGIAFLAQFLPGLFQSAMTIFGVVGGPLLALFSLGMFTFTANQAGSVIGLVFGIGIASWISVAPKPAPQALPTSVDGCGFTFSNMTEASSALKKDSDYFWLYRISYLYNGVVGLLVTFIVGLLCSYILRKITGKGIETENYDPNLFIPLLSRKLIKQKPEFVEIDEKIEVKN